MRRPLIMLAVLGAAGLWLAGCAVTPPPQTEDTGPVVQRDQPAAPPARAPSLPPVPDGPLGLEELVALAGARNPDLVAAAHRIEQARAAVRQARAAFLPTVSAEAGFEVLDWPSFNFMRVIDARELDLAGMDFNEPGVDTAWQLGASTRWNLYRGGSDVLQTRIARTGVELTRLERAALTNQLVAAVIASFYDVLAARELVSVARASERTVAAQVADTRTLLEGGATGVRRADLLALEVRQAEAREQALSAQNAESLSMAALANLLGLEADRELQLSTADWQPAGMPATYDQAVAEAMGHRPELEQARVALRQALLQGEVARRQYLPRVDLVGRAGFTDDELRLESHDVDWMVGVAATWDLFRGGARRAGVERAQAAVAEVRARDRKATLAVELDVRSAFLRRQEAEERLLVAEGAVRQAEEALELSATLYRGGAATSTRYLEAELALTRARVRKTRARYDLRKATADLGRAMGWCGQRVVKEMGS
jgi:outer membrane protein TolC